VVFDLTWPIDQQLKRAKYVLETCQSERGKKLGSLRLHKSLFANYLRILDAKDAGATEAEIAGVLFPGLGDSGVERVSSIVVHIVLVGVDRVSQCRGGDPSSYPCRPVTLHLMAGRIADHRIPECGNWFGAAIDQWCRSRRHLLGPSNWDHVGVRRGPNVQVERFGRAPHQGRTRRRDVLAVMRLDLRNTGVVARSDQPRRCAE